MRLHLPTLAALLLAAPALSATSPHHHHQASQQQQPIQLWRKALNKIGAVNWAHHGGKTSIATADGEEREVERQQLPPELLSRYGKDVVWRFNLTSAEDALALAKAADQLSLDVWEFNENWADVRLAKDAVSTLLDLLPPSLRQSHTPLFGELELAEAVFASYPSSTTPMTPSPRSFTPSLHPPSTDIFFQEYRPLSVITPWMRLMSSIFTTHVRFLSIGVSYEGRDIPALRLGVHPKNNKGKPSGPRKTILVTGGSHAREWISTSTVTYVAWSIITSYGKSALVTSMLESFDWVFIPTLNPDGYVYSWETDRLWRKSRQPTGSKLCVGIDLDRSYPFHWDGNVTRENPCSESYAGKEAFEGVEAKRFAEWAKNETEHNNVTFVGFLDLHSYSQQVLWPYSYSCEAEPPGLENLEELALGLAKAMRLTKGGAHYMAASACEGNVGFSRSESGEKKGRIFPRIESGGGSALDWFYEELKVEYAYQIKLRDTGSYGFLLPKGNIVPTGREALDAVYYLGKYLMGEVGLQESGNLGGSPQEAASWDDATTQPHEEGEGPWELRRRRL